MKSIITIAAILSTILLTSCGEKDWVCTCTDTTTQEKDSYRIEKVKKKLAKQRCTEYYENHYFNGIRQVDEKCVIE